MARLRHTKAHQLKAFGIHPKYQAFFRIETRRSTSTNRHVAIVVSEKFSAFLLELKNDSEIPQEFKVLTAILLSGGLRISEALMLQRSDFETGEDGRLYFVSRVLKKRDRKVERTNVIHQDIQSVCAEYLMSLRGFEHLFSFSRKAALHQLKKYLGEATDLHGLRHSFISYLVFLKELNLEEVSRFVEVSPSTAMRYAHLNQREILSGMFLEPKRKKKLETA
jgi:integrase